MVKWATEKWATEKLATGKKGNGNLGNHLGKNGQQKIKQPATGKNGNGKLGNQSTVNGIHLKESTQSLLSLIVSCVFHKHC